MVTWNMSRYLFHYLSFTYPLHEYVFIKNNIIFNENAAIVLHLDIIVVSFHIVFSHLHENDEND